MWRNFYFGHHGKLTITTDSIKKIEKDGRVTQWRATYMNKIPNIRRQTCPKLFKQHLFHFFIFHFSFFLFNRDLRYLLVSNLRGEADVDLVLKECSFAGQYVLVRTYFFFVYCCGGVRFSYLCLYAV